MQQYIFIVKKYIFRTNTGNSVEVGLFALFNHLFIQIQSNSWPDFLTVVNFTYINMCIYTYIYIHLCTFCLKLKKFVCSVSLFLSHIGLKRCWPIRLQDFKSNIYLEQSNEIVYFFTCWYQQLKVDRKILGWVWSEMVVATLVTRWMNDRSWFFMLMQIGVS